MTGDDNQESSCVRLFLSVDLVGSTAFKNTSENSSGQRSGPPWANLFFAFYTGFPKIFGQGLGEEIEPLREELRPALVKTIGDELLLQTRIRSSRDAVDVVRFFTKALAHYTKHNLASDKLLLKGTAWIAGFPINNCRVAFESRPHDFIGPSMDTGFRISRHASPSKLVVAVDLALLLLSADRALDEMFFEGTETLRGVLGGRPYPIIWHKVDGEHTDLHSAELRLRNQKHDKEQLRAYCAEYINSCQRTWLIRPYFLGGEGKFSNAPEWHMEVMRTWARVDERNSALGDTSFHAPAAGSTFPPAAAHKVAQRASTKPPKSTSRPGPKRPPKGSKPERDVLVPRPAKVPKLQPPRKR